MPGTSFALLLAILAMIGMPPSAGFVTKWYLLLAVLEAEKYIFVAAIFVSTLLMMVYFWRVIELIYIRPLAESGKAATGVSEVPANMLITCLTLGILTFAIGIAWLSGGMTPLLDAVNQGFGLGGG
jgi:multicomponent Na+:H+ antiporter subunit D